MSTKDNSNGRNTSINNSSDNELEDFDENINLKKNNQNISKSPLFSDFGFEDFLIQKKSSV